MSMIMRAMLMMVMSTTKVGCMRYGQGTMATSDAVTMSTAIRRYDPLEVNRIKSFSYSTLAGCVSNPLVFIQDHFEWCIESVHFSTGHPLQLYEHDLPYSTVQVQYFATGPPLKGVQYHMMHGTVQYVDTGESVEMHRRDLF